MAANLQQFQIQPAVREDTPIIIGLAGPSKSGKTYSAHRVARGIARAAKQPGPIVMLNAEGKRGHQYADQFEYLACDIAAPFSYERYHQALDQIAALKPSAIIIDSVSHAHDGPGGMIEQHEKELDRIAGPDATWKRREACTWAAWIKPKDFENRFIYAMTLLDLPIILCFRAKEKIKIVKGADPIDLGYQPIASEKIAFETLFSLLLPPRSKGVPDLALSDLRDPFEGFILPGQPLDEELGARLAEWAVGRQEQPGPDCITADEIANLETRLQDNGIPVAKLKEKLSIKRLALMKATDYPRAGEWIDKVVAARKERSAPQ